MEIRAEQPEDLAAIRRIHRAAFGRPGEANLVDQLRGMPSTVSFVAVELSPVVGQSCVGQSCVGHVFFSPVTIAEAGADDSWFLGLAPVAVLPAYQGQGIGSLLIRHGLTECAQLGCKAVVVLGAPKYYRRFGFVPAREKQLGCEFPVPDEAFMVLELEPGALEGWTGIVKYRSEFNLLE